MGVVSYYVDMDGGLPGGQTHTGVADPHPCYHYNMRLPLRYRMPLPRLPDTIPPVAARHARAKNAARKMTYLTFADSPPTYLLHTFYVVLPPRTHYLTIRA